MKKCLLWSKRTVSGLETIKKYQNDGKIQVVGFVLEDTFYERTDEYKRIAKEDVKRIEFDYIIIMANGNKIISSIRDNLTALGLQDKRLILIRTMQLDGFDFEKYETIKENTPTIFAPNCWGGILYHSLNLQFKSPLINMYESHEDYLKFLRNPKYYLNCELKLIKMCYQEVLGFFYPVVQCGDIVLYFNHCSSFEEAEENWIRRKERIDWDNIIVMFFDESKSLCDEFFDLNYKDKICISNSEIDNENGVVVDWDDDRKETFLWDYVNKTANGKEKCVDLFELLANHRVVKLNSTLKSVS